MIDAEIRGKLGRAYGRAHERAEDVLTSTVFGLLRYIEWSHGLGALLRCARSVVEGPDGSVVVAADPHWIPLSSGENGTVSLWPRVPSYGEPDVLVSVFDGSGRCVAELIIEAKLWSGKSLLADGASDPDATADVEDDGGGDTDADEGEDEELDEEVGVAVDPDQLVRYWQLLANRPSPAGQPLPVKAVVYLTAHASPPCDELHDSLVRQPGMRLLWLSWHDAWDVARRCLDSLPAGDIVRLLAHKGLSRFDGFRGAPASTDFAPRSFWQGMHWFAGQLGDSDSASFEPRSFWSCL